MTLEEELRAYRAAYGRGASVFAAATGGVEHEYWYALSGASHPDYNMALVSDGDVHAHAAECIGTLFDGGQPGVGMLAGRGLAAAQVLADAGWATVASMPMMKGTFAPDSPLREFDAADSRVRPGTAADLPRARQIMSGAFGVDVDTAGIVYSERVLEQPGVEMLVAGDGDEVGCVSLTHQEGDIATNWALATDHTMRRRGYVMAMMPRIVHDTDRRAPGGRLVGLATPAAEAAHRRIGAQVCEYWQVWSRPRWMLASA